MMHHQLTLVPPILKASASLLTLTKPKSLNYTCYFAECWAPTCPTHGVMHQRPPDDALNLSAVPPLDDLARCQTHSCATAWGESPVDNCLTPPRPTLSHSHTAPNGVFRCYAPTCEAVNCPRHQHIAFPQSPPHSSDQIHGSQHLDTLVIPIPLIYTCPDLTHAESPSSPTSTDSYLRTPTAIESMPAFFPTPITVLTPDLEEDDWSSRSSMDSVGSFPCPPSIIVEPPSARSSMHSVWSVHGHETDGYDGSSEMEGIPRRTEALGAPGPFGRRKVVPARRAKGKENVRPERMLKHKPAVKELRVGGRATREMFI